jgi:hypothetical protein
MDHLPQHDIDHIRVPFVAEARVFTPGDFFSFPKDSLHCTVDQLLQSGPSVISPDQAAGFLQSWLFFALLAQVLNENIDSEQFVRHRQGQKEVSTEDIISLFDKSPQLELSSSPRQSVSVEDPDRSHQLRASLALEGARNFILAWCSDSDQGSGQDESTFSSVVNGEEGDVQPAFKDEHPEICLSVGILGESLDRFWARHRPRARLLNDPGLYGSWENQVTDQRSWGFSKLLCKRMIDNGWCPQEVRRINVTAGDLSSMYYISSFRPVKQRDHSTCDYETCRLNPWRTSEMHTEKCPFRDPTTARLLPDEAELKRIVNAGNIPLLRFNNIEELTLSEYVVPWSKQESIGEPAESSEQPRFVAISHVWSDGLGPVEGVGLPGCQLSRIRDTLKKDPETRNLPFWIDSLCVPQTPKERNKAFQMMGQVYSLAFTVLVLDSTLRKTSSFPETLEAIVRVNTGVWSTRMWTLPEGVRARNLHFDFKNGLLSTRDLRRRYEKAKQNPLDREHHVYKAGWLFSPHIFSMRHKIDDLQSEPKKKTGASEHEKVAHIWQSMQWREASRVEDETLCLARLLDIDPLPLLQIESNTAKTAEHRMIEFLDLLDQHVGIPPGMIFLPGPKLRVRGFSWAPCSWMCKRSRDLASPLFVAEQRLSFLTRNGLHVQYPGILLHPGRNPVEQRFWVPTDRNLTRWYRVEFLPDPDANLGQETWADIWKRACSGDEAPAIVFSRFDPDEPKLALLVEGIGRRKEEIRNGSPEKMRQDVKWVRSLCRVSIQRETDHAMAAKLTQDFLYNIDLMSWGEALDEGQRWVVDGIVD